ncbi:MAG: SusD/RagB family nutrient-binding outer membrane lipoprotein [Sphingobacterium sp.]|nr:SusD/RagB family nutrient-binding outer membrane lipoprotein [Sphingobacterium sp.]
MKRVTYFSMIALALALGSCTKDLTSLNDNPAGFSTLEPGYQFTKVQAGLAGDRTEVWRTNLLLTSPMIQHLGGAWGIQAGGQYNIFERIYWETLWNTVYPRDLKNIQDVVDKTKSDPEQVNMHAAAKVMRVFIYAKMTDLYGDIPYSEAIKGYTEGKLMAKYDKQEDIYMDFFKELDEANALFDLSKAKIKGDIFYDGDVAKWKRFTNSLRLRLGMRVSNVNPTESKKQVEAALMAGVMTSNDDIAMTKHMSINYADGELRGNGASQVFKGGDNSNGFKLVTTLVDYMKNRKDPRLPIYGGTYLGDGVIGVSSTVIDITKIFRPIGIRPGSMGWSDWNPGITDPDANGVEHVVSNTFAYVQPSVYVSALNAPSFHLTYAEVEFLKAEAALRGWGGLANPVNFFDKGIEASCAMMSLYPNAPSIAAANVDELKNAYKPFPTSFEGAMDAIHGQMWVNFFLNGPEAYSNYRRTGYPSVVVPSKPPANYTTSTNGVIPKRFIYPMNQVLQNKEQLQIALDRMGGKDDWLSPVWWDK